MMVFKSFMTSSTLPPIVPSSRYQMFNSEERLSTNGCNDRLNKAGPSGSPCWTPDDDWMMWSPNNKADGVL